MRVSFQDSDTSSLFKVVNAESAASLLKGQSRRRYQDVDTDSSGFEQPRKPRPKVKAVTSSSRTRAVVESRLRAVEKTMKSGKVEKADSDKDSLVAISVGSQGEQSDKSAPKSDSNNSENSKNTGSTSPSSGGYQASGEPSSSGEVCSLQDVGINRCEGNSSQHVAPQALQGSSSEATFANSKRSGSTLHSTVVSQLKECARMELQQTGSDEQTKCSAADSGFQSTSTMSQYNLNTQSSGSNAPDSNSKSGASSHSAAMGSTSGSMKDTSEISDMDVT